MQTDILTILKSLADAEVRYLVVGGVAVVLHGHVRMTADLDLILGLEEKNATKGLAALDALGFRPRAPVAMTSFANRAVRESWIRDKGLMVFSLWNPKMPLTEVDLFVSEPFDFDSAHARAIHMQIAGTSISVAAIDDLIALKTGTGRDKDASDIRILEEIRRTRG